MVIKKAAIYFMVAAMVAIGGAPWQTAAGELGDTVRVLVKLKRVNGDIETRRSLRREIREIKRISKRAPKDYVVDGDKRRAADLRQWRVIEVSRDKAATLVSDLNKNAVVEEARIEQLYRTTAWPNDPYFKDQYDLFSDNNPLADINAKQAWGKTTGSRSTVIAVIDGGVDLNHEDLQGKIWRNQGEIAGNGKDDDGNGFVDDVNGWDFVYNIPVSYAHSHATHVAGIAAAESNNGKGVTGVDWQAKIMSVRVLGKYGTGGEAGIAAGIEYAVANGAKVINLSIAGGRSTVIEEAIENAYANGVVVVAAAGNQGGDVGIMNLAPVCSEPSNINMVIGVGATDKDGEPTSFSNYGRCVDISAPGKRIISTVPGNRYKKMSGTSMSAPLVAGAAGLYLSLHPGASPAEVIAAIKNGDSFRGRRAEYWNERYKGKLNLAKVVGVQMNEEGPSPTPPSTGVPDSDNFVLQLTKQGPSQALVGGEVKYTLELTNNGSGMASEVVVKDGFNKNWQLVSDKSSTGCQEKRRGVECRVGEIAAGESKLIELVYLLDDGARCGSRIRERATVYAQERGRSRRQAKSERVVTRVMCGE